jgi:hypothetical protein
MKEFMTIIRMTETDHFSGNVVSRTRSFKNHKKAMMYILDYIYAYDAVINGVFKDEDRVELSYYENEVLFTVTLTISVEGSE